MIMKTDGVLAVEGPVVQATGADPDRLVQRRIDIDVRSGLIRSVGDPTGDANLVLGPDYVILPGIIDVHVHAREDPSGQDCYKETFETAGAAAIHGGVTAFVEMPNNPLAPIDDRAYGAKRELTRKAQIDVLLFAGVGPGTEPLSFPVPYKVYMGPSVGELFFESDESLREALARYRGHRVAFHAEAPEILDACKDAPTHHERRPPHAEVLAIERVIESCNSFQVEPHICHLTTAAGLDVIRKARSRGIQVSCEVTPHHLFYDEDNVANFHTPSFLQVNPPIRTRLDRLALLEALKAGEIEYLATDHAPHTLEENETGISGMPQLDTYGPFLFWLSAEGVTWGRILEMCCERPGQFLNRYLPDLYGRLAEGFVGSLTVLKKQPATIRRESVRSTAGWSLFEGVRFDGRVSHTIVRGVVHSAADS